MSGSALADALALVDFGACRDSGRPAKWIEVAEPMCAHCKGSEDVNLAAARIIADAYRDTLRILADPRLVHINMLHGTIAWTPENLRHVLGDSSQNDKTLAHADENLTNHEK
jgi:hypothetical protein